MRHVVIKDRRAISNISWGSKKKTTAQKKNPREPARLAEHRLGARYGKGMPAGQEA
jgi:hypothetical protein